jgi:predicted nucleic acid-binding protein
MIVVDASLAVKWLLTESGSDAARDVLARNAGRLAAPDLVVIEVAATFVRTANVAKTEASDMELALDSWVKLVDGSALQLFRATSVQIRDAALLAQTLGHPLKDCIYLALARKLDCDFLTCDARFVAKAAMLFPRARLLAV